MTTSIYIFYFIFNLLANLVKTMNFCCSPSKLVTIIWNLRNIWIQTWQQFSLDGTYCTSFLLNRIQDGCHYKEIKLTFNLSCQQALTLINLLVQREIIQWCFSYNVDLTVDILTLLLWLVYSTCSTGIIVSQSSMIFVN